MYFMFHLTKIYEKYEITKRTTKQTSKKTIPETFDAMPEKNNNMCAHKNTKKPGQPHDLYRDFRVCTS